MTGCACGHHHHHHHPAPQGGAEIRLDRPLVALAGRLICTDMDQMLLAMDLLPGHTAASRAEPGCLRFDIAQDGDDPMVWTLSELFADDAAFAAHQARTADSGWGRDSGAIRRDFTRAEALPRLRPETRADQPGIAALHRAAFGAEGEARLVDALRADGDLALSLVAEQGGTVLGHVALSPVAADAPALALAPLAVHPAVQGRGIGAALTRVALQAFPDHTVIVLGDPDYYGRFGFRPADLLSPYAGPHLLAAGPALPAGGAIAHARAFAAI